MANAKKVSKRKEVDTSNHPYVSNYPALRDWLAVHGARCMWQLPMQCPHDRDYDEPPTAYVEQYQFPERWDEGGRLLNPSRLAIVVVYGRKMGRNIFTSSEDPSIAATLEDAERRLGFRS